MTKKIDDVDTIAAQAHAKIRMVAEYGGPPNPRACVNAFDILTYSVGGFVLNSIRESNLNSLVLNTLDR